MSWTFNLKESTIDDLRWFGKYRLLFNVDEEDDLIDSLLEHNPKFRQTLKKRLKETSVSVKDACRRI